VAATTTTAFAPTAATAAHQRICDRLQPARVRGGVGGRGGSGGVATAAAAARRQQLLPGRAPDGALAPQRDAAVPRAHRQRRRAVARLRGRRTARPRGARCAGCVCDDGWWWWVVVGGG
jgi:hypothetical protein